MAGIELVALAERLQGLCLGRGLTVCAAESCTGGMLAEVITDVPGSSGYFLGSIVSYGDTAKAELLGVPEELLVAHGAVSAQVARAMVTGARERFAADLALSVTGVAGPDGGTPAKPVGLTYLGLADTASAEVRRFNWAGDRKANREASVQAALAWLIERADR